MNFSKLAPKHITQRVRQRLLRWERKIKHYNILIRNVNYGLSGIVFIASVLCLIMLIVYTGYEHDRISVKNMYHYFHLIQGVFIVNVFFNLIFNLRKTLRETRPIKCIVDVAIITTLFPILYPLPENPWSPWLAEIVYSNKFLLITLCAYSIVAVSYGIMHIMGKRTNPSLILSCSFLFCIFAGSFLLMMPKCTYTHIDYIDALFVSTSAVCITGLTTIDIPSTFTPLGLAILAMLIQIGGLGVMTFTSFFALFFSGNASVYSQLMVKDMIYTKSINSLLPTLLYIFLFTIVIEAIGAVFIWMSIHDVLAMSVHDQIIFSAFHSMSAFCNAGFSNLPGGMANPALMNSNQMIYIIISIIVFAGSIGFPILVNFRDVFFEYVKRGWNWLRGRQNGVKTVHIYNLNTKIALYTTSIILFISIVVFFALEQNNSLAGLSTYDKVAQSIFNSTTPRSSGFVSVNPAGFLNVTLIFVLFLMWVGGASQSTAGGIKVNTLAAVLINLKAIVLGRERVTAFNRTIAIGSIRRANAVVTISLMSFLAFAMILMLLEPKLPAKSLLFETMSALFTVGSSLGITPLLSPLSKILLTVAMFLGRVGIISLLIGVTGNKNGSPVKYPTDNLIIN
ncbi:potassium transporter TrkG [uncultured Muribaculum sp.]|uniref:TrkH family potassium uptake protein n=1 Tax=uncultured Muribaculum sp. TaxID=1918613 RepID=UPI002599EE58|nr:potassium transporter TrkG [uncultured Muribaculum sp.]